MQRCFLCYSKVAAISCHRISHPTIWSCGIRGAQANGSRHSNLGAEILRRHKALSLDILTGMPLECLQVATKCPAQDRTLDTHAYLSCPLKLHGLDHAFPQPLCLLHMGTKVVLKYHRCLYSGNLNNICTLRFMFQSGWHGHCQRYQTDPHVQEPSFPPPHGTKMTRLSLFLYLI